MEIALKEIEKENLELKNERRTQMLNAKSSDGSIYLKKELEKANLLIKDFEEATGVKLNYKIVGRRAENSEKEWGIQIKPTMLLACKA